MHLETFFFLFNNLIPFIRQELFPERHCCCLEVIWKLFKYCKGQIKWFALFPEWYTSNHKILSQLKQLWIFSYREGGFLIKNYLDNFLKSGESRLRELGKSGQCRHGFILPSWFQHSSLKQPQIKVSHLNFGGFQCSLDLEDTIFFKKRIATVCLKQWSTWTSTH